MKAVTQEQGMGCAVACVASRVGTSYKRALLLFQNPKGAAGRGYYCPEIIAALQKKNKKERYRFFKAKPGMKLHPGDIVFVARSKRYPLGHYLLKTSKGWMNPWINFPCVVPAKAGFQKSLPGKAQWVVREIGT